MTDDLAPTKTPYERAKALLAEGSSPDAAKQTLIAEGLEAEGADLLTRAVFGASAAPRTAAASLLGPATAAQSQAPRLDPAKWLSTKGGRRAMLIGGVLVAVLGASAGVQDVLLELTGMKVRARVTAVERTTGRYASTTVHYEFLSPRGGVVTGADQLTMLVSPPEHSSVDVVFSGSSPEDSRVAGNYRLSGWLVLALGLVFGLLPVARREPDAGGAKVR